jgi:hypothetical protein
MFQQIVEGTNSLPGYLTYPVTGLGLGYKPTIQGLIAVHLGRHATLFGPSDGSITSPHQRCCGLVGGRMRQGGNTTACCTVSTCCKIMCTVSVSQPGAAEQRRGSPGARRRASRDEGCCRRLLEASTTGTDAAMPATITLPSTPVFA